MHSSKSYMLEAKGIGILYARDTEREGERGREK
jgi:hypothetical protein